MEKGLKFWALAQLDKATKAEEAGDTCRACFLRTDVKEQLEDLGYSYDKFMKTGRVEY